MTLAGFPGAQMLGKSIPRIEDLALVSGKARFADDINLPDMLHIAFVRSPHAHAEILKIDATAALAMPGVHAVWGFADIKDDLVQPRLIMALPSKSIKQGLDRTIMADRDAVYVGELVAAVIADSRYLAEDAAALVDVTYDVLPAVSDCVLGAQPGATLAHRGAPDNLVAELLEKYGDIDQAFANPAHRFHVNLWAHRGGSHSMEGRGVIAIPDALEDKLTVWSSTQTPHTAKRMFCEVLGLSEDKVRVALPDVGGGFGPKLVFYCEDVVVALAARRLGRPMKWIEDRREHFVSTTQERDENFDLDIATDAEGKILGIRGTLIHDHGAWTARGVNVPENAAHSLAMAYVVPALDVTVKVIATNKVPVAPLRGAGQPEGVFAIERVMDVIARGLNIDRAELRRRNLWKAELMPVTLPMKSRGGIPFLLDSGDYPGCLDITLKGIDWAGFPARQEAARAAGRYLGIGIANYVEGTGRGPYEHVNVRIEPSGRIFVATGAAAMGQGVKTLLAQIVAEQLGADMSLITVSSGDTATAPIGMGGFGSRQTVLAGNSAHAAAVEVRERVLRVASTLLEADARDLEIVGNQVRVVGAPQLSVTLAKVAKAVLGKGGYLLPDKVTTELAASKEVILNDSAFANGCAAAEVEVDIGTGAVTVRNIIFGHDCGRAVNPMLVDGQVHGGVAHGIGNSLFERMLYDEGGQPLTTTFAEYLLVTATEMPPITILHMESPTPGNALGIKGVGEAGVIPIGGAISSAIEDALSPFGVRVDSIPVSPVDILAKLNAAQQAKSA